MFLGQVKEERLAGDGREGRGEGDQVDLAAGQIRIFNVGVQAVDQRSIGRWRSFFLQGEKRLAVKKISVSIVTQTKVIAAHK